MVASIYVSHQIMPPAARGALFEKTAPLDPPQKLFIARPGHGSKFDKTNSNAPAVQTKVFGPTFFQKGGPPEASFLLNKIMIPF
jgi:hypothetical protein